MVKTVIFKSAKKGASDFSQKTLIFSGFSIVVYPKQGVQLKEGPF